MILAERWSPISREFLMKFKLIAANFAKRWHALPADTFGLFDPNYLGYFGACFVADRIKVSAEQEVRLPIPILPFPLFGGRGEACPSSLPLSKIARNASI
jgi:hypothetical protein